MLQEKRTAPEKIIFSWIYKGNLLKISDSRIQELFPEDPCIISAFEKTRHRLWGLFVKNFNPNWGDAYNEINVISYEKRKYVKGVYLPFGIFFSLLVRFCESRDREKTLQEKVNLLEEKIKLIEEEQKERQVLRDLIKKYPEEVKIEGTIE